MQYFFIAGNIASIAALIGFLLQLDGMSNSEVFRNVVTGAIVATAVFWIYFYLSPANRLSSAIRGRLNYTGRYKTSQDKHIDIFEDTFEAHDFSPIAIAMPPFESPPEVSVFRKSGRLRRPPTVADVSRDVVTFNVSSNEAFGTWAFRARGKALTPASKSDA